MNRLLYAVLFLLLALPAWAQKTGKPGKSTAVKAAPAHPMAPVVPVVAAQRVDSLAAWLLRHYPEPEARIQAAYAWVTSNIRYDHESAFEFAVDRPSEHRADSTLAARQDVCAGIAELFVALCRGTGLEAYTINGYARQDAMVGHAWAAVRSGNALYLYDPTWDVNRMEHPTLAGLPWAYFRKTGEQFRHDHMPFDPIWQLSAAPISYAAFDQRKPGPASGTFAYLDSIAAQQRLNPVQQMQATYRRMAAQKATNYAVTSYAHALKMEVLNAKINNLNDVWDRAANAFNSSVKLMNEYIGHYNKRFADIADKDLTALMQACRAEMELSDSLLVESESLTNDPAHQKRLADSRVNLQENSDRFARHETFVKAWLTKGRGGRNLMWVTGDLPN